MRELGVVIARVPAMLRPQIQEAASAPQLVPGRLLHAGRESTASPLNIPTAAAVWVPG